MEHCLKTGLELFGEQFSTPVMTAALSHLGNVRENGMVQMAEGARLAGAVSWAGMGDEKELEDITATGARTIKIIKPYVDNDYILKKDAPEVSGGNEGVCEGYQTALRGKKACSV